MMKEMSREIEFRAWCKKQKEMTKVIVLSFNNKGIIIPNGQVELFENIELMQYTGLKDKNGVKIFEGDIVKLGEEEICFIEWDEYDCSYRIKNKEVDDILAGFRPKDFEVIGNIYKNPELLEVM